MKTLFIFFAFCFILIAAGCKTDNPITIVKPKILDSNVVFTDTTSIYLGWCLWNETLRKSYQTCIINDTLDYKRFQDSTRWSGFLPCDTFHFPIIDFNRYTLLGRYIRATADSATRITKTIFKNDYNKKYIFYIKLIEGHQGGGFWEMNWTLIPKLPKDWRVEFDSTYVYLP